MSKLFLPLMTCIGLSLAGTAIAQKKYDVGATDTEIKIGNIEAYSGPASAYGQIGRVESAYFKMINEQGGINGRKVNFISYDDGYSPPKTVEMARKLVEQDEVLAIMNPLGTSTNTAIQKYMNAKKVPHLFLATGASKWNDPQHFPWTMGWQINYHSEGAIYAKAILKDQPNAKIGIIYQNDDFGKDYIGGFKEGLGPDNLKMIVSEQTYEVTDPTIDSQIIAVKESGANVFVDITTPKFAAMAIRKVYDTGWKPVHYLTNVSVSVGAVMKPAGPEKGVGIISSAYLKDPTDKQWANDPGYLEWLAFMKKYMPDADLSDYNNAYGYAAAQSIAYVLKSCGDNLTRENLMKQAASIKDLQLGMALPGVKINTSATDFAPFQSMKLMKFDGASWQLFGDVLEIK